MLRVKHKSHATSNQCAYFSKVTLLLNLFIAYDLGVETVNNYYTTKMGRANSNGYYKSYDWV